ncbi:hypothetical protein CRG98_031293 [Punica granatum]|uniref:Uncharacterized protein n=1 Tax=Punica granatum TaxID=22663 RepID=A0A2I0IWJ4_PUNGR|nr:hypothetical protein CRG98_031293 [Punica granatum]
MAIGRGAVFSLLSSSAAAAFWQFSLGFDFSEGTVKEGQREWGETAKYIKINIPRVRYPKRKDDRTLKENTGLKETLTVWPRKDDLMMNRAAEAAATFAAFDHVRVSFSVVTCQIGGLLYGHMPDSAKYPEFA